jgi:hypothetical protein
MPLDADAPRSVTLDVGDEWVIGACATDDEGWPAAATVSVTVTDPAGASSAPTPVEDPAGTWTARHTITLPGRYLAVITATGVTVGVAPFTAWAVLPTMGEGMPTTSDCLAYLGDISATDGEILDALTAEAAAQRARCRVPAVYPPDLRQALLRRVARNLAARAMPLTSFTSFEGGGTSQRVPRVDAEIARFEGPYRRRKVG